MKPSLTQEKFLKATKRHKRITILWQIFLFVFFFALWEISAQKGWINDFIFSSPSRLLHCFISMSEDGSLFYHIGITMGETLISFFIITAAGLFVAVLLWLIPTLSEILEPYLVMLNSLPKTALAPVLIVWLGNNMKTIIIAAISVAVFGTIINLYTGFCSIDPEKVKLIYTLGGTKRHVLFKVILPSTIPLLVSTMKVNIGLSLVGVIIGEFLAANAGLGYLIIYGSQVFKMDWVILSIIILCLLSIVLYEILQVTEKLLKKRYR